MEWIIPCDENKFKLRECIKKYGYVDWHKKVSYSIGDYIYIYCSRPASKIKYVMQVIDILSFDETIEDGEFGYDPTWWNCNEFARLKLIKTIDDDRFSLNNLLKNGLTSAPQSPRRVVDQLSNYINNSLK